MYNSCLDESKLDERDVKPLLEVVHIIKALFNGTVTLEEIGLDNDLVEDSGAVYSGGLFNSIYQYFFKSEAHKRKHEEKKRQKEEKKRQKEEEKRKKKEEKKHKKEEKKHKKEEKKRKRDEKKAAEKIDTDGLTAALAYMHSRGMLSSTV